MTVMLPSLGAPERRFMSKEYIYAFTNAAMPGLIKIGYTDNLEKRLKALSYPSGVPVPFECLYAAEVENGLEAEAAIHATFAPYRLTKKREFFKIEPDGIVALLKFLDKSKGKVAEVTDKIRSKLDDITTPEDKRAINSVNEANKRRVGDEANVRRSVFTFSAVGICRGAELVYIPDPMKKCKVVDERHVAYDGNTYTLSGLAGKFLQETKGYTPGRGVNGTLYFRYGDEDETLNDRRYRLEEEADTSDIPKPTPVSITAVVPPVIISPPIKPK